jgi:hypothetical protein
VRYLLPGGIGDVTWAFTKIEAVEERLGTGNIEIYVTNRGIGDKIEDRSFPFLERFPFVKKIGCTKTSLNAFIAPPPYMHIFDGKVLYREDLSKIPEDGIDAVLCPISHLEDGLRLENWLPEFKINWDIMKKFQFTPEEEAYGHSHVISGGKPYICFYFGPETANTTDGPNRGPIWTPDDWTTLALYLNEQYDCPIVCVGADYDRPYWTNHIEYRFKSYCVRYIDAIGGVPLARTFQILKNARFMVAHDSGLPVVANYMGTPTVVWWRAHGDSISPHVYYTKDERQVEAWVSPDALKAGRHLGLIYGRQTAKQVADLIVGRGW